MIKQTPASSVEDQITWPLRPVMTSLNGDNSWLLSFPCPFTDNGSKFYYHAVLEPWLSGPTVILNSWLIHIALRRSAGIATVGDLETVISKIETSARTIANAHGTTRPPINPQHDNNSDIYQGLIDIIILFFHYGDHVHEPTLSLFDKRIPVIASPEAKKQVDKMAHFDSVSLISHLDPSATTWQSHSLHPAPLPPYLTALKCLGHHELNFVASLIWTHENTNGHEVHEAIFSSPHGLRDCTPVETLLDSEPRTMKLAMLHGLKESWALGSMNTFGATSGLALYRRMGGARYWVLSHDSPLVYSGFVMWLVGTNDRPKTLEWALEQEAEREAEQKTLKEGTKTEKEKPNVVQVENGGSLVLI